MKTLRDLREATDISNTYARDGDTVKDGFATITYAADPKAYEYLGGASLGGAGPGPDYYQTKRHVAELQRQLPGVWIRSDGAFQARDQGVDWAPSSVKDERIKRISSECDLPIADGTVAFGLGYERKLSRFTLAQLQAITRYIEVETNHA